LKRAPASAAVSASSQLRNPRFTFGISATGEVPGIYRHSLSGAHNNGNAVLIGRKHRAINCTKKARLPGCDVLWFRRASLSAYQQIEGVRPKSRPLIGGRAIGIGSCKRPVCPPGACHAHLPSDPGLLRSHPLSGDVAEHDALQDIPASLVMPAVEGSQFSR